MSISDWFKPRKGVLNIIIAGDPNFSNLKYFISKMNKIVKEAKAKTIIELSLGLYLEKKPLGMTALKWAGTRKITCCLYPERNSKERNERMLDTAKMVVVFGKLSPVTKNLLEQAKKRKKIKVRRIFGG